MDKKVMRLLIHVLKEEHVLKNYSEEFKQNSLNDLTKYCDMEKYYNLSKNPNQIISHMICWGGENVIHYCISLYKFVYFLKRRLNFSIDYNEYNTLIAREYIYAKRKELDTYIDFLLNDYLK